YVQQGATTFYSQSICGAYQAFFDSNIQSDFVSLDVIDQYKMIYLPYPVMLKEETVEKLRKYVQQGGFLISEGLPGYFGDHGHVGAVQPNYGLDEVFGARESYVEFMPDISDKLTFQLKGSTLYGRYFRQGYQLNGGTESGQYPDGLIAVVEHKYGQGRTLLMGTFPGAGYFLHHETATRDSFADLLKAAGITQAVSVNDASVQARLHNGAGGAHLWVTNPTRQDRTVKIRLSPAAGSFRAGEDIWGRQDVALDSGQVTLKVPARDAAVIALS